MPEQLGEKMHEATPHRRQQARQRGHVPKSQDLGSAVLLLAGIAALMLMGESLVDYLAALTARHLGQVPAFSLDQNAAVRQATAILWELAKVLLPIMAVLAGIAATISVGQTGFLMNPDRLAPDISRISPLKGLARIFSLQGVARLLFGLIKVALIAGVTFLSLYAKREEIVGLAALALPQIAVYLVQILFWTTAKIGGALLVLAVLEYAFQRWKYEQDLRMSTAELKEEMRQTQGSPETAQRRKLLRQLAASRLTQAVPGADFVLTNPTELAIAIRYDPATMVAPVVAAKGAGAMAARIRQIALENGIPVIERKPLAQAIYKAVEVNHPIPRTFYAAVSEILRYVYELKGKPIPTMSQQP